MQRRIKILMLDMDEYHSRAHEGFRRHPDMHHILLSNCHNHSKWIEKSLDIMNEDGKETLCIGVDV